MHMIFDKNLCACVEKNKNLIRRPWLTARESALEKIKCTWYFQLIYIYIYFTTLHYIYIYIYIYILSAVFFHVRPPRFGSVVKAAATGAAGRFSVSLYKKWYKNWLKTIFFVGKIQEKGVEVSAKDITKICIVVKIQWKKRFLGQNTMEKGVVVSAKYITKKCISGKIK